MKYRNKETGVEIDVNSEMGGVWAPVEGKKAKAKKTEKPEKTED